jgi:cellulose synthase/poly-beta-1,6-N-acetylglucosamine synthase-like glycosyltransferase
MTGAARLGATVTLLGSAYLVRRDLLSRFPFSPEHRLEDIDLSLRLLGAGYRVAWEPNARCRHEPAADRRAFRAQHAAWARGYHRLARQHAADLVRTAPSMWLAADRLLFVGGYLDRVSLLLAVALWLLDATMLPALWMPAWFIGLVIALPLAQMPLALRADGWPWRRVGRALLSLPMAAWDLLAEWTALFADLARRPVAWRRVPRAGDEGRP